MAAALLFRLARYARRLPALFLLACVASPGMAQIGAFSGQAVDDSTSLPLPRLKVYLIDEKRDIAGSADTDDRGLFTIPHSKAGVFQLFFVRSPKLAVLAPADSVSADSVVERIYKLRFASDQPRDSIFFEYQVHVPARVAPGYQLQPKYPRELEQTRVEGTVVVQYIVDTTGHAEMRSVKRVKAADERFFQAVVDALRLARFTPAMINGHKVRQRVQQSFEFLAP